MLCVVRYMILEMLTEKYIFMLFHALFVLLLFLMILMAAHAR